MKYIMLLAIIMVYSIHSMNSHDNMTHHGKTKLDQELEVLQKVIHYKSSGLLIPENVISQMHLHMRDAAYRYNHMVHSEQQKKQNALVSKISEGKQ